MAAAGPDSIKPVILSIESIFEKLVGSPSALPFCITRSEPELQAKT